MSDNVMVKLDAICDRTGKKDTLDISIADATSFQEVRDQRTTSVATLKESLEAVPAAKMPDLVVAFRGKVVVLANINPKSDEAVMRLLHDLTRDEETFPKPVPKTRKPRKPAVEAAPEPPVENAFAAS